MQPSRRLAFGSVKTGKVNPYQDPPVYPRFNLPDLGIPEWQIAPVHVSPRLHLYREDLCVDMEFFHDHVAQGLDAAIADFFNAEPFYTPLSLDVVQEFSALENAVYLTSSICRHTGFERAEASDQGAIFTFDITPTYRRHLVVGAPDERSAQDRWWKVAHWARKRLRILRAQGKAD
jgi:hypothetical protein